MRNTRISLLLKFVTIIFLIACTRVSEAQKLNTVVIDAGHGGHDSGAKGKNSREKDIALDIVLKLRDNIRTYLPQVKVILTRDNDEFVELFRRAKIANESKADLFISVHCNANPSSSPSGTETYVMGLHKSEANLAVAKAENAAILLEDNYVTQYDGFDPASPEGTIFFSMMQNAFLDKSLAFAGSVQKEFSKTIHTTNRGVKQAGFLVLYKTSMPSVLVETGFISNANEEKFLRSENGQNDIASALFHAFCNYKSYIEKKEVLLAKSEINPDSLRLKDFDDRKTGNDQVNNTHTTSQPVEEQPVSSQAAIVNDPAPLTTESSAGLYQDNTGVIYRVQYTVSPKKLPGQPQQLKILGVPWYYEQNRLFKYTIGAVLSFAEADKLRLQVVSRGYKDAFVVAFLNDKRISNDEARKISGK